MVENKSRHRNWEKFIKNKYDPLLAKKEVEENFLYKLIGFDISANSDLLIEIIFEKLTEYFLENGWTFEVKEMKMSFENTKELYLYPPKK